MIVSLSVYDEHGDKIGVEQTLSFDRAVPGQVISICPLDPEDSIDEETAQQIHQTLLKHGIPSLVFERPVQVWKLDAVPQEDE